jgi:NADH dehydrogenase
MQIRHEFILSKIHMSKKTLKRILILGGGFAGLQTSLHLERIFAKDSSVEILLISRDNFILFTPMLAEVVSGSIEAKHVVSPLREFFRKVIFQEAEVKSVDFESKIVCINHWMKKEIHEVAYDYLVLAPGSETNFFGLPGVEENSFPFKTISDAMDLRNHVIDMFELADMEPDARVRRALLTFVIAGGGFAGEEVTAELNDFIRTSRRFYRHVRSRDIRIVLVVSGSRLMPELREDLAAYALNRLRSQGIEFYLNTKVQSAGMNTVQLENGDTILSETLIWTAGVAPDSLITTLSCTKDKKGRVMVNEFLEASELPDVWAVGDCASVPDSRTGSSCPPTAQHAVRQGRNAAHNVAAAIQGDRYRRKPFSYSSWGMLAPLGYRTAVAEIRGVKFSGFFAWWLWRTIYLIKLPDMYSRVRVALDWTLDLFFPRDIVQLKVVMKGKDKKSEGSAYD